MEKYQQTRVKTHYALLADNPDLEAKTQAALARIDRAIATNPKIKGLIVGFSGGHDSIVAAHVASQHPFFLGVLHVNTKTSPQAEMTSRFARKVADLNGWRFIEVSPFTTLPMLAVEYGFPSPDSHEFAYQYLKGRPFAQGKKLAKGLLLDTLLGEKTIDITGSFALDSDGGLSFIDDAPQTKARQKLAGKIDVAIVSGIRRQESTKRSKSPEWGSDMGRGKGAKSGGTLWINAIVDWSKLECSAYINACGLMRNETADKTGASGECDCFAHASRQEVELKCATVPLMDAYRAKLEELIRVARELQQLQVQAGMRDPKDVIDEHDTVWGNGRKGAKRISVHPGQMSIFSICNDCDGKLDEQGNTGVDPDLELIAARLRKAAA